VKNYLPTFEQKTVGQFCWSRW